MLSCRSKGKIIFNILAFEQKEASRLSSSGEGRSPPSLILSGCFSVGAEIEAQVAVVILVDPGLSSSDCSFLFQHCSQVGLQTSDVWYKASLNLHRDPSSSQRSLAMFVVAS